jgi:septum site-determining protein MinD
MGVSVCLASGKGGSGKSTICANLGVAISQLGYKTAIVDADVEGSSMGLIFGIDFKVPTIHEYLSGSAGVEDIVLKADGVELAIGSVRVEDLKDLNIELLKNFIKELMEKYDVVLVDAPSGLGIDAITAISACDAVLLVATPDILSVTNSLKTKVVAERLGKKVLGLVLNRVGSAYDIPTKYIEDIMGIKVIGEVAEDEEVKKSLVEGKVLLMRNPSSKAAKDIFKLAEKLVLEYP